MNKTATTLCLATCALTLGLGSWFARAESDGAERVFRDARDWTVHIRNSVDQSFVEDEQGYFEGAGFVVDAARGWVVTNAHVASRSYSQVQLSFRSGPTLPAKRLYVDPYLDLAVLGYDPAKRGPAQAEPSLACDRVPDVGHPVGAFGHPYGMRYTGTRGIVSAVTSRYGADLLQTDAPINAGNSGGPLISLETGKVVGISAASLDGEGVEGLNFAVPMPSVCRVVELLRAGRDPSPPENRVDFALDDTGDSTLYVGRNRLPAGSIDLRPGDEILSVGASDTRITSPTQLLDTLRGNGGVATLKITRAGKPMTLTGNWPLAPSITKRQAIWFSGVMFAEVGPRIAEHMAERPALMVHHVEAGSLAQAADLMPYDMLISADGVRVDSLDALRTVLQKAQAEQRPVSLLLARFGGDESSEDLLIYLRRAMEVQEVVGVGR